MSADQELSSEDLIYGGRVRVRQPARGYRVNIDTILLAASLGPGALAQGARVVEAGCGVGAAILIVARTYLGQAQLGDAPRFVGIEREARWAAFARQNVALNALGAHVEIVEADALAAPADLGQFDAVLFNPPYDEAGMGRAPAQSRRAAHIAERPLGDWIKVWCNRMAGEASLTLIHRPQRLGEALAALDGRLGGVEVFPIRARAGEAAKRIMVRARKGSRAPLKLHDGLNLHPAGGVEKYTPETEAILRGEAFIALG